MMQRSEPVPELTPACYEAVTHPGIRTSVFVVTNDGLVLELAASDCATALAASPTSGDVRRRLRR